MKTETSSTDNTERTQVHRNNRLTICTLLLLLALTVKVGADSSSVNGDITTEWEAGTAVSRETIRQWGTDKFFTSETVSDAVFARMQGKSYKKDCSIPRGRLRYLRVLHHDGKGGIVVGEMVCNRDIADDLLDIFKQLYESQYPIERMVLIDNYDADDRRSMEANNSSCFNFRKKTNPAAGLSKHAQGLAIDINPLYNPYYKRKKNGTTVVEPESGRPYINRQKQFKYKITKEDLCYRLFTKHGFTWGGNWKSAKDYQHFEK